MVAIYVRKSVLSTDPSMSIETQISKCKDYLKGNDYSGQQEVFVDDGYSGKNTLRPKFQELMGKVEMGLVEVIIVYRLDRISRNVVDFYAMYGEFKKHGIVFISCMEKFDTSSKMGEFALSILINFAEMERESIAQRVKDSYYMRAKNEGRYLGGRIPYAYSLSKDERGQSSLKPNDEEMRIVEKIFYMYAYDRTTSLYAIRKYLLDTYNIRKPAGSINSILTNPIYTYNDKKIYNYYKSLGCKILNDGRDWDGRHSVCIINKTDQTKEKAKINDKKDWVVYCTNWQGVIDSRTFILCQERLSENKRYTSSNESKGRFHELSGLVKCAKCGFSVKVKGKSGTLSCCGRSENQGFCMCSFRGVRVEHIQEKVAIQMQQYLNEFEKHQKAQMAKRRAIQGKIDEINKEIRNLVNAIAKNPSLEDLFIEQIEERREKRNQLNLKRISDVDIGDKIDFRILQLFSIPFHNNQEVKDIVYTDLDEEQKKALLKIVVKKILLHEDGEIDIVYN